jgi:cytochrome c biogenesis factor
MLLQLLLLGRENSDSVRSGVLSSSHGVSKQNAVGCLLFILAVGKGAIMFSLLRERTLGSKCKDGSQQQ